MPDYQQGKIYKLTHGKMFYYGSTTLRLLCQRLALHHVDLKKRTSKLYTYLEDKDWNDVKIELIENYPCSSVDELHKRETEFIEPHLNNPLCLNSRCALPTEKSVMLQKEKNNKRKQDIIECEVCKISCTRGYMNQHVKSKTHCEMIGVEYNPTAIRSKEALQKQKEQSIIRGKEKIKCDCGVEISKASLRIHKKSDKHKNYITSLIVE